MIQRNIEGYAESKTKKAEGDEWSATMSIIEESPQIVSSIRHDYTKRLMVFGGRASMEQAARIAGQLDVDLGRVDLRTFADGEVIAATRSPSSAAPTSSSSSPPRPTRPRE